MVRTKRRREEKVIREERVYGAERKGKNGKEGIKGGKEEV